jgi:LDH2 family malate/lactate/ureidoglycolate dehydrogenase
MTGRIIRSARLGIPMTKTRAEDMSSAAAIAVPTSDLVSGIAALFVVAGLTTPAAKTVADDLVRADVEDVASHGVMLVPMYLDRMIAKSVSTRDRGEIVSDRGGAVVIDAGNAFGQLTAHQAVDLVVERARQYGLAAVTVRNAFHFGMAGRYARRIAEAGAVGLVMSNTRPLMPAPGGAEALVGNNPIAIAVPSAGNYAVEVDMALSASAMGKIRLAEAAEQPIPEGWAVDREGRPTTDAAAAIAGMLLPAAGPKGFGLAFVIDLLCGGLSSGGVGSAIRPLYGNAADPYNCSHAFVAIDVAHFRDPEAFAQVAQNAAAQVSRSRKAPGTERVYAPGELAYANRTAAGDTCRVSASTVSKLIDAGHKVGVDLGPLFARKDSAQ